MSHGDVPFGEALYHSVMHHKGNFEPVEIGRYLGRINEQRAREVEQAPKKALIFSLLSLLFTPLR